MPDPVATILVVDDEAPIRRFLRTYLASQNYRIIEAASGGEGLTLAASQRPDVILLDLGLPDMDGMEALSRLKQWSNTPVIVLSARGKEEDKIVALDAGAEDYLTKPFGVGELAARIRVSLRLARTTGETREPVVTSGDLRIDLADRRVFRGEIEIRLTPIEFKLLAVLARNAGKVLTHTQLLAEVWGGKNPDQAHYPRIYVHQLRNKIEADPARPRYLRTETGVGYRFMLVETG
jgi:two-component system KDP operon response regulator KdpE